MLVADPMSKVTTLLEPLRRSAEQINAESSFQTVLQMQANCMPEYRIDILVSLTVRSQASLGLRRGTSAFLLHQTSMVPSSQWEIAQVVFACFGELSQAVRSVSVSHSAGTSAAIAEMAKWRVLLQLMWPTAGSPA